jgi:hypothetical protein
MGDIIFKNEAKVFSCLDSRLMAIGDFDSLEGVAHTKA